VGPTIRLYYDTIVAIALMAEFRFCSPARFGSSTSGAILRPAELVSRPHGWLPRTTLHACLALQGTGMSIQTVTAVVAEETHDGFILRGSEMAKLSAGYACSFRRRASNHLGA
jgi:hypothetical protein